MINDMDTIYYRNLTLLQKVRVLRQLSGMRYQDSSMIGDVKLTIGNSIMYRFEHYKNTVMKGKRNTRINLTYSSVPKLLQSPHNAA